MELGLALTPEVSPLALEWMDVTLAHYGIAELSTESLSSRVPAEVEQKLQGQCGPLS